jgi:hypothetical protein
MNDAPKKNRITNLCHRIHFFQNNKIDNSFLKYIRVVQNERLKEIKRGKINR